MMSVGGGGSGKVSGGVAGRGVEGSRRRRACWFLRVPNGGCELRPRSCARKKERRGAAEYGDGAGQGAVHEGGMEREQQHGCRWMSTSDQRSATDGRGGQRLRGSGSALLEVHG